MIKFIKRILGIKPKRESGDLYISFRKVGSSWSEPRKIV